MVIFGHFISQLLLCCLFLLQDILCEMLDLVKPADPTRITLSDLKRCKLTPVFLNTFINFKKFLDIQQRQNVGLYRVSCGLKILSTLRMESVSF